MSLYFIARWRQMKRVSMVWTSVLTLISSNWYIPIFFKKWFRERVKANVVESTWWRNLKPLLLFLEVSICSCSALGGTPNISIVINLSSYFLWGLETSLWVNFSLLNSNFNFSSNSDRISSLKKGDRPLTFKRRFSLLKISKYPLQKAPTYISIRRNWIFFCKKFWKQI